MKDLSKYKEMKQEDLQTTLVDLRKDYFDTKFQFSLGKLENTSLIREKRRTIAQVKTLIQEKQWQDSLGEK